MSIVVGLVIIVMLVVGFFMFIGLVATLIKAVVWVAIFIGVIALTLYFPYVMIPLLVIGYFLGRQKEQKEQKEQVE